MGHNYAAGENIPALKIWNIIKRKENTVFKINPDKAASFPELQTVVFQF